MNSSDQNKQTLQTFIQTVWIEGNLDALNDFWTEDCVNHAQPGPDNRGLAALRAYHEGFTETFSAFSEVEIQIMQQIAEADRVVMQIVMRGTHRGPFFGVPATGKRITLSAIRIDRMEGGKIAEHWSVADLAGLMATLQNS